MTWIYVAAAIFGCGFLIPMVLGGLTELDADAGGELDAGGLDVPTDVDVELDVEFDAGDLDAGQGTGAAADGSAVGGLDGPAGAIFASLFSFRAVVFFSAFFGVAGLVFGAIGYGEPATAGSAVLIGLIAMAINAVLFGLLKDSEPNSQISDRTLEGRWAKVVLPMSVEQRGRIRVDLSGQPQYLVAKPLDDGSPHRFDVGTSVVVVKIENGTALVSSVPELDEGEEL